MAATLDQLRAGREGGSGRLLFDAPVEDGTLAGAALCEARRALLLSAGLQWAGEVEVVVPTGP
jgi:hypothetical protein